MRKVTAKEYNKLFDDKMKEISEISMDEKFMEMFEWFLQYKIVSKKQSKKVKNNT